jgi:hypothetical protein
MSRSRELVKVDLLGATFRAWSDRAQYQEEIVTTPDGRSFTVPFCGRYTPVRFKLQDGRVFCGRYTVNCLLAYGYSLGVRWTLIEVPDTGEVVHHGPHSIVHLDLAPSRTARPPELEPWGDEQAAAPASGTETPNPATPLRRENRKVKVNRDGKVPTVTLEDGVTYAVSPEGAAVVEILIRNSPKLVTYREMTESSPIFEHQDPQKVGRDIIDKLAEAIRDRIKREPGKGCTWLDGLADPDSVL